MRLPLALLARLAFTAIAASGTGCGPCTENNVSYPSAPPDITVFNSATGQSICDAGVVARSATGPLVTPNDFAFCRANSFFCPDASVPLVTFVAPDASTLGCSYGVARLDGDGGIAGIEAVPGSCTLFVSMSGFQSATVPNVNWQGGGCKTGRSQQVRIALRPD